MCTERRSGAEQLWSLLAGHPCLACSAGTELIRLCDQAASTWRAAEASGSTLSTLAAASVRAMAGNLSPGHPQTGSARRPCPGTGDRGWPCSGGGGVAVREGNGTMGDAATSAGDLATIARRIPAPLLEWVSRLNEELGYLG